MDAPPENEDCLPFLRVAGYLESMRLNAPRVLEANLDEGFLLLSDLGSRPYLAALQQDPDAVPGLYADAIDALLRMQRRGAAFQSHLPPYDEKLLRFELSLFHDWLCGTHLGIEFTDDEEAYWQGWRMRSTSRRYSCIATIIRATSWCATTTRAFSISRTQSRDR